MIHGERLVLPVQFDGLRPSLQHIPCSRADTTWVGGSQTGEASSSNSGEGYRWRTNVSLARRARPHSDKDLWPADVGMRSMASRENTQNTVRLSSAHLYAVATVLDGLFVPGWLGQAHHRDGRPGDAGHDGAALTHVVALLSTGRQLDQINYKGRQSMQVHQVVLRARSCFVRCRAALGSKQSSSKPAAGQHPQKRLSWSAAPLDSALRRAVLCSYSTSSGSYPRPRAAHAVEGLVLAAL